MNTLSTVKSVGTVTGILWYGTSSVVQRNPTFVDRSEVAWAFWDNSTLFILGVIDKHDLDHLSVISNIMTLIYYAARLR